MVCVGCVCACARQSRTTALRSPTYMPFFLKYTHQNTLDRALSETPCVRVFPLRSYAVEVVLGVSVLWVHTQILRLRWRARACFRVSRFFLRFYAQSGNITRREPDSTNRVAERLDIFPSAFWRGEEGFLYDLRRRRRRSASTLTPHQYWNVCTLKKSTRTAGEEGKPLLPAMANSHSKGGPASFRPSGTIHTNTKACWKRRLLIPKRHKVFTLRQKFEKEGYQQARSGSKGPVAHSLLLLFSLTTSLSFEITARPR